MFFQLKTCKSRILACSWRTIDGAQGMAVWSGLRSRLSDKKRQGDNMRFGSILVATVVAAGSAVLSYDASAQPLDAPWVEAQSLRELPAGVQVLLGVGLPAREDGIADRGENYNPGDVIVDDTIPGRRFVLGVVSGDSVVVAVERGGRGSSVQTLEFKQVGTTWAAARCVTTFAVPHHGNELLDALAHPQPNLGSCRLPAQMTLVAEPATGR
jgi:hypothetical protein